MTQTPSPFPNRPNDPFYRQFDDPLRAYNNLPGLYRYYLTHPDKRLNEPNQMDYVLYARRLAYIRPNTKKLPNKKQLSDQNKPEKPG